MENIKFIGVVVFITRNIIAMFYSTCLFLALSGHAAETYLNVKELYESFENERLQTLANMLVGKLLHGRLNLEFVVSIEAKKNGERRIVRIKSKRSGGVTATQK